jgi:hypothetical protein
LKHELGFHFNVSDPQADEELERFVRSIGTVKRRITVPGFGKRRVGKLVELEFFGVAGVDSGLGFDKLQYHFEKTFGKPAKSNTTAPHRLK